MCVNVIRLLFVSALFFVIGCNDNFVVLSENIVINVIKNDSLIDICDSDGVTSCTVLELSNSAIGGLSVLEDNDDIPNVTNIPHFIDFVNEQGDVDVMSGYLNHGIQGRVTSSGLEFVSQNISEILNDRFTNTEVNGPGDTPHICISPNIDDCDPNNDNFVALDGILATFFIDVCPSGSVCDGRPGCRLDINFNEIEVVAKDFQTIFSNYDFDELKVNVTLDLGLGVPSGCGDEPPIDRGCNGVSCDCGASGRIPLHVRGSVLNEVETCELAIAAKDFHLSFDVNFGTDLPSVGRDNLLSSREFTGFSCFPSFL